MLILMGSLSVPVILIDVLVLRVHRNASAGLEWEKPRPPDLGRVVTKLLRAAPHPRIIALAYWAFPEYTAALRAALRSAPTILASLLIIGITYVWFVDGLLREPRDVYWQLGRVVLVGFRTRGDRNSHHFRGWLVEGLLLPAHVRVASQFGARAHQLRPRRRHVVEPSGLRLSLHARLRVDLLFTTAGYALSLRYIDTHIRTAERRCSAGRWHSLLPPFFSLMERQYVAYGGGPAFCSWLAAWPSMRTIWAVIILALLSVYTLATVAFGVRFSNLTHRGILREARIDSASTPLTSRRICRVADFHSVLHRAVLRGAPSFDFARMHQHIYLLARPNEERHLSRDPDYVAYALWMNDHGVLEVLGTLDSRTPLQTAAPSGCHSPARRGE